MARRLYSAVLSIGLTLVVFYEPGLAFPQQANRAESDIRHSQTLLLVLNQDEFSGTWKQFKGALKQTWGAFTDDDLLYIEGSYDKYEGKLQERYGDRREEIKQWTDEWFSKHDDDRGMKQKIPVSAP